MSILPSCSYYLRRLLKKTIAAQSKDLLDLLEISGANPHHLDERLRYIYSNIHKYHDVILHLETLTYSHQQAQSHQNQMALDNTTQKILWWLGYKLNPLTAHPRIVIVDDSIEILKLVKTILSTQGYQVDSALNGQLALTLIQDQPPDLILLDLNLPDMDGYQVYKHLQSSPQTACIPVIFVSGTERPTQAEIQDFFPSYSIIKPFKPNILIEKVQAVLGSQISKEHLCKIELQERQQQALQQLSAAELGISEENQTYFFRATLDGRYLRASQKLAQLWDYTSSEEMISQVTNLWQQIYHKPEQETQWHRCLNHPNKIQTWVAQIKTQEHGLLDIEEKICMVQDDYQQNLFFQGYIRPLF